MNVQASISRHHAMLQPVADQLPWRIDDIDFTKIEPALLHDDEALFLLLVSASFIESGSDIYTRNLVNYYHDFPRIAEWLSRRWEQEELQHGRALQLYIQSVWPDYPWREAFQQFLAEYQPHCSQDEFEPSPALELAARCVIETGTASYYRMLYEATTEPVLRTILDNIRRDELRHFKYFYRFFRERQRVEQLSGLRIVRSLLRRAMEINSDDGWYAFKHAYAFRYPQRVPTRATYREFRRNTCRAVYQYFPCRMAAEMFITPLNLSSTWRFLATRGLSHTMQLAFR